MLKEDYIQVLEDFNDNVMNLGLNIGPKVYAVFFHVHQSACKRLGRGIRFYSEQALESAHHDFCLTWDEYKINLPENPTYINNLKQAIIAYNYQGDDQKVVIRKSKSFMS